MPNHKKSGFLHKKTLFVILVVIIVLIIMSTFYLLKEMGIIKYEERPQDKNFSIQDKCSIIVGKIIHPIDREDECMNKCIAQCETYRLKYANVKFESRNESCNSCDCFCD